jgi:NAD(P)-dependent dehydrogenase (short-subunit alcohol dehydrogenase family)
MVSATHSFENVAPLSGQVALVTGASRGIGRAIATALAQSGSDVWLASTNVDQLRSVAESLQSYSGKIRFSPCDVTDRSACFALAESVRAATGKLDILVNSAGAYKSASFLEYEPVDFEKMLSVNLYGTINTMQAVLPMMYQKQYGRIVNIASIAGKWGSFFQSAYNVSKHAVVGLTRCVALEAAGRGVTINAICPGLVETEMLEGFWQGNVRARGLPRETVEAQLMGRIPLGRLLDPAEIAGLAVYLASPIAGGITGQSIVHDGGMVLV